MWNIIPIHQAPFQQSDAQTAEDNSYYNELKSIIKATYKNAFNFRLRWGIEV